MRAFPVLLAAIVATGLLATQYAEARGGRGGHGGGRSYSHSYKHHSYKSLTSKSGRKKYHSTSPNTASKAGPSESCGCGGGNYCVGPRGGHYCYTASGNKRYI